MLHLARFVLTTLPQDTSLKLLLQPQTTLNFQLLATDHPYTCNYTTENTKLTFTASNPTELHAAVKMEKTKHNSFDVWLTVPRSSMWIKRPTRCHLVLYLFLLYRLLNMFRATLCPSSGADDLVVFFRCVAEL